MKQRSRLPLVLFVVLLLVGIVAFTSFFYSGKPQPKQDFQADINAPLLSVPDQDKGWLLYRELWIKFDFGEGGTGTFDELYLSGDAKEKRRLVRPSDGESWHVAVEKLNDSAELLEGFRIAAQRPFFGLGSTASRKGLDAIDLQALYPKSYQAMLAAAEPTSEDLNQNMPLSYSMSNHLLIAHKMPELLIVDSRLAMEQNDIERITRNLEAIFGMARQISDNKFVMEGFLGLAFSSSGIDLLDECLQARVDFDAAQFKRLAAALEQNRVDEIFRFSTERITFADLIQHSYTDDGNGDGRITWRGLENMDPAYHPQQFVSSVESVWMDRVRSVAMFLAAPTSMLRYATRKQMTEKADHLFERVDAYMLAPLSDPTAQAFEVELENLPTSFEPIKRFLRSSVRYKRTVLQRTADREGALAALAVLRFKQQHGTLPATWEEMVGTFLEDVPKDPVDGQPLRYKIQGKDFYIYSVGANLIDDGGLGPMLNASGTVEQVELSARQNPKLRPVPTSEYDLDEKQPGDWILWPRFSAQSE